jgi:hypothetical protein
LPGAQANFRNADASCTQWTTIHNFLLYLLVGKFCKRTARWSKPIKLAPIFSVDLDGDGAQIIL